MVIITVMDSVVTTIAVKPAPNITMKIGPSATFGILLKTTIYGSSTADKNGDHQMTMARRVPSSVPSRKPTTVSPTVMTRCGHRLPLAISPQICPKTLVG
ncbi:hypothetical protein D3C86_1883590 [compost metagenome]